MLRQMGRADLVIPYQREAGDRPLRRRILSRTFTRIINILSGYNLRYYNGSPVFVRYHLLRLPPVTLGFGFQADVITRLLDEGCSYVQVERFLSEKKAEASTAVSMRNLLSVIHACIEIVFRRIRKLLYGRYLPKAVEIPEE